MPSGRNDLAKFAAITVQKFRTDLAGFSREQNPGFISWHIRQEFQGDLRTALGSSRPFEKPWGGNSPSDVESGSLQRIPCSSSES